MPWNMLVRITVALAIFAGSQSGLQAQYPPTAEALAASEQAQRHSGMVLAGSDRRGDGAGRFRSSG